MERTRYFVYVYRDLDGKAQYVGYGGRVLRATSHQSASHNRLLAAFLGRRKFLLEACGPFGSERTGRKRRGDGIDLGPPAAAESQSGRIEVETLAYRRARKSGGAVGLRASDAKGPPPALPALLLGAVPQRPHGYMHEPPRAGKEL